MSRDLSRSRSASVSAPYGCSAIIESITLLVPAVSLLGAVRCSASIRSDRAQAFVLHGDVIHTIVLGAVIVLLIYLQRAQFGRWIKG